MRTMITLGDMAAKGMTMLEVACRRCDGRGQLSIARLVEGNTSGHLFGLVFFVGCRSSDSANDS
jgi:hypothetical protein